MTTHIQTWTGQPAIRITDMANAGKRGKKCRTISFHGWYNSAGDGSPRLAHNFAGQMMHWAEHLDKNVNYEEAAAEMRGLVFAALADGIPEHAAQISEREIRGIDAPKPLLTAGVKGRWTASADESGITVHDEVDQNNLPACITHGQTNAAAYQIAKKVWPLVEQATSFSDTWHILSGAGAKLHYYCRMD